MKNLSLKHDTPGIRASFGRAVSAAAAPTHHDTFIESICTFFAEHINKTNVQQSLRISIIVSHTHTRGPLWPLNSN